VLPLLRVVAEERRPAWLGSANAGVRFEAARDRRTTGLRARSGARGPGNGRELTFRFRDAAALATFFAGGRAFPRINGALRHPLLLVRVLALLSALRVMRTDRDPALRVKLTVRMAALGLAEMHRAGHPAMVAFAAKSPERVYQ